MEKRQQKTALTLKYAKRRFDGGQEIDLIRAIERQNHTDQLNRMYGEPQQGASNNVHTGVSVPLTPVHAVELENMPAPGPQPSAIWQAVIMGPLQVAIGAVGVLTACLALVTFRRVQNEVMVQQSRLILHDCAKTFRKGLWDTLTTPARVYKASLKKV